MVDGDTDRPDCWCDGADPPVCRESDPMHMPSLRGGCGSRSGHRFAGLDGGSVFCRAAVRVSSQLVHPRRIGVSTPVPCGGYMHLFSYLGGIVGILAGVVFQVVQWKSYRPDAT